MMNDGRTCRVGIHGRNAEQWDELDYQVIHLMRAESVKMMSQTSPVVFKRLKQENSNIEIITRLYDDRFGVDHHPTPAEFVDRMVPIIRNLLPYCNKFEIHNEPNHPARYEGWGHSLQDARSFNQWFLRVYDNLKSVYPSAEFLFPGLAIPHNDIMWAKTCEDSILRADGLCVHCYWQTPPGQEQNHLSDSWGLRFKAYHELFPRKDIYLTEVGNSNVQNHIPISEDDLAREYFEHLLECFRYKYLKAWCPFILSSPDSTWDFFAWRTRDGRIKPVVQTIGSIQRPTLKDDLIGYLRQRLETLDIERNNLIEQIKQLSGG